MNKLFLLFSQPYRLNKRTSEIKHLSGLLSSAAQGSGFIIWVPFSSWTSWSYSFVASVALRENLEIFTSDTLSKLLACSSNTIFLSWGTSRTRPNLGRQPGYAFITLLSPEETNYLALASCQSDQPAAQTFSGVRDAPGKSAWEPRPLEIQPHSLPFVFAV